MRGIWLFSFSSWGLHFALLSHAHSTIVQRNAAEMNHLLQLWSQMKAEQQKFIALALVPLQNQRTQWETRGNCNRGRKTFGVGKLRVTKQTRASPWAKDWASLEGPRWTQNRVVLSTPGSPALQKLHSERAAATAQLQQKFSSLKGLLDGFINGFFRRNYCS